MCLAVPAKVIASGDAGFVEVDLEGVRHRACTDLVPHVTVGDYVLLHAGFAISIIDPLEAEETLKLFRQLNELVQESSAPPAATSEHV